MNTRGAVEHRNSCNLHAAGVQGGTKALSMSTRRGVRCSAVDESAHIQQTPLKLHDETWAGILRNQVRGFSREVEIVPGCAVAVACPSCPDHSPEPLGSGRMIRNMLGWSQLKKTDRSEVSCFGGVLKGENIFLPFLQRETGLKRDRTAQRERPPWVPLVLARMRAGLAKLWGRILGERCWPLLSGLWRAIAPLMKPWCAEGEVPTAANLNLYRGWKSCVGWHRDDEPLFESWVMPSSLFL